MNVNQNQLTITDYCRQQGLPFSNELLARYVASVLTKPFVILAGVSGTGKSKLAQLVAEYYALQSTTKPNIENEAVLGDAFVFEEPKTETPDRFALVAVRPDWIDNQSILGFVNPLTGQYESTKALDIILRANEAVSRSKSPLSADRYFMLLDEMNLARVEHYFSDWLACSESRRLLYDGTVDQQAVPLHRSSELTTNLIQVDGSIKEKEVPRQIKLPTNLIITGTVNVDETTYGFSSKVLDRSMVIEFDDVDLEELRDDHREPEQGLYNIPKKLPPFRLPGTEDYRQLDEKTHTHLVNINKILEVSRLHFGYRTANEIAVFIDIFSSFLPESSTIIAPNYSALDFAILQKVLPRLSGNRAKLELPLTKLCFYLRELRMPEENEDLTGALLKPVTDAKLSHSYHRAIEMLDGLRTFGFVSFFK